MKMALESTNIPFQLRFEQFIGCQLRDLSSKSSCVTLPAPASSLPIPAVAATQPEASLAWTQHPTGQSQDDLKLLREKRHEAEIQGASASRKKVQRHALLRGTEYQAGVVAGSTGWAGRD